LRAVIFVKESVRLPGKHMLEICGEPMLARIYRVLKETGYFEEVVVYSKYRRLELKGLRIERDRTEGVLIDSIISAIENFGEFIAVGGDMPLIDKEVVSKLLDKYDGRPVAAVDCNGILEPLFAIYNNRIYDNILEYSRNNRQIFPFLMKEFSLITMSEEQSAKLFNVNTEKDFEEAREVISC
jgi:molybdopterin-guanine dinucleotide biosynthesis protein A